jgi:hypothetical protein
MGLDKVIKKVDLDYSVENILINGKQFWPLFRVFFFDAQYVKGGTQTSFSLFEKIGFLFSSFYGFFKWFVKADYLVLSNSDQRKEINDFFVDKSADYINLSISNTLHIELPVFKHFSRNKLKFKRVVSHLPLRFLEAIYSKLFLRNAKIDGLEIIDKLNSDFNLSISGKDIGMRFLAQYQIMKWLLVVKKPKAIFLTVSYMKHGYVLAARDLGIPVIEMQHGIVTKSSFGYTNYKKVNPFLFPNYFLSYGEGVKDVFTDGNYTFSQSQIIPIGHYYLDLILKGKEGAFVLNKQIENADVSVSVSLQDDSVGNQIVPILMDVANKRPNWIIVFVPRKKEPAEYKKMNLPANIIFLPELNVYEVIALCDVHTTVFSTCAIEAPTLGKPNVLINLENKAKEYFSSTLTDARVTRFANSAEGFIEEIEKKSFPDEEQIKESNKHVMVSGFDGNLKKALEILAIE